jgi:preprotein translocase subunit SecY
MLLLKNQGILPVDMTVMETGVNILVITAGSMLLVWLGELVSEFGIGNGVSLIIFAGIVSGLPTIIGQFVFGFDASQIPMIVAFIAIAIVIIIGVVMITEAERPVQVTHAKQVRGNSTYGGTSTYLPLRVNQAGVIPIIFALSILLFPTMVINVLSGVDNATVQTILENVQLFLNNQLWYGIAYFVLVVIFTFFYTAVTFDPESISKNLQRSGAFIPGVRPGDATAQFISRIVTRITLIGALALATIAVLPIVVQAYSGLTGLTIGGTSLLIAVSVVIDLIKKTDAQISMREY